MKKILIIPSWYPNKKNPGLGSFFREQAALFEEDFDVRILAGHLNTSAVRVKKLKNTINFSFFNKVGVQIEEDYFLEPPGVYGFTYSKGINKKNQANFKLKIHAYITFIEQNILPDWQPDLIHAQNTHTAGIIAHYISKKINIPYLITEHHHLNPKLPGYLQEEVKQALQHSKINCFVSEWQYRTYLLLDDKLKGELVGNPVNSDFFVPAQKITDKFVITHASNADVPKDIETLIVAINQFFSLIGDHENIVINLVGFPEDIIHNISERWSNNKWFEKIRFHPPLSKEEYLKVLQSSDVFIMSSIYESFGLAPLEAMMCGIPVVTTNNGGVNEYLIDGLNGIKVPLKDSKTLAEALGQVFKNRDIFDKDRIRDTVVDKFGIIPFKQKMMKIYAELSC